jgi:hypothetical protein
MRSDKRSNEVIRVKKNLLSIEGEEFECSRAEIARYLGVATSAMNRMPHAEVLLDVDIMLSCSRNQHPLFSS